MYVKYVNTRGLFLMFVQPEGDANAPIKCLVRKVALRKFGHYMMGRVRIYGKTYSVSGAYGGDGLPMSISREAYDRATVTLPKPLYDAWNKGGGWNSAGNEAMGVREWALDNLETLRK